MKAMVIEEFGGPDVFVEREVDTPEPDEGQVRIRVVASSVNPLETKIRSGLVKTGPAMPAILNGDVSGVVDKVGPGVAGFAEGDEVFGCAGGVGGWQGALADFMIADVRLLGKRTPAMELPLADCAALPLVFLTAWSALVDRAGIQPGEHVLIHAGTGGVGNQHAVVVGNHRQCLCDALPLRRPETVGIAEVVVAQIVCRPLAL